MVLIRAAVAADAEATARCHLACWRETYGPLVDDDRLVALTADVADRTLHWRAVIGEGLSTVRLAEDDGEIVGLASAGPSRDLGGPADEQLHALYVRRSAWGTGLGHGLLVAVLGDRDALLWVLDRNDRARHFYTAHGFVPDGTQTEEPQFGGAEIRMVRRR